MNGQCAEVPERRLARPQQTLRLGLVGGMSWPSTLIYYERLNRTLERRCGPHHSFDGVIWNLDYASLYSAARAGDWSRVEATIGGAAAGLARAGCDVIVLTAVTAHLFADQATKAAGRPVLHILAGAADELRRLGMRRVGVLGTAATCSAPFLAEFLGANGREILRLDPDRQQRIDTLIQNVLTAGAAHPGGAEILRSAASHLHSLGAEAVLLACTELPLLLPVPDIGIPILDCVALHVEDICNSIVSDKNAG